MNEEIDKVTTKYPNFINDGAIDNSNMDSRNIFLFFSVVFSNMNSY